MSSVSRWEHGTGQEDAHFGTGPEGTATLGVAGERGSRRERCLQLVQGNDGDRLTRCGRPMTLTAWAAGYAEELLAPLGARWAHVQGVVRQAQEVAAILPAEEREVLATLARTQREPAVVPIREGAGQ
jgi:hypothetical protein